MRILTINGIRTDGTASTDLLGRELADLGHEVVDINYPKVNIFTARSRSRQLKNAQHIMEQHQLGDAVVAHSYGCLLALRAMELGALFSKVFYFGAAMNDDFVFPRHGMIRLLNFHNPHDSALTLGNFLWFHDFGNMGKTGYDGCPDGRIHNRKLQYEPDDKAPHGHSFYFHKGVIEPITKTVHEEVQRA